VSPIQELVARYRASMTSRCECGEAGCPGEVIPSSHDPRVMGMVLAAAVLVMQDLVDADRIDQLPALVADCAKYVKRCSEKLDDRVYGLSEIDTERMVAGFFDEVRPL
jgi:hypothetical protein